MAPQPEPSAAPRTPLTRERVLRAAISLADQGGIESLSMRRLGQELGVEAMSLYNHVANKNDILDGIVDIVVSQIDVPSVGADWKAALRQRAISAHEVLLRHPWASMLMVSRVNVGPAMLRYVDSTIGTLRQAGFSIEMADHAWNAMDSHIYGFTLQKLNFPFDAETIPEAAATYLPTISADEYPHLAEMSRYVMESSYSGVTEFEFGLDLILDGLERLKTA
ncbi:MAG TPA: TetR family transcriptional regulator [Micromonosporaceae bacterium]|nr:TetR family transcriptional regulator [Micromonosporaceae bacterium]HCU51576.1 TetR family transcriptional regulator [Micromonosporaceae bacterium]